MNKRLMTDMADANGLQRAIRPSGFFNIKKMAADFCSAQCIIDNTGSLTFKLPKSKFKKNPNFILQSIEKQMVHAP